MDFPRIRQTFGVTPYNPDRDSDEKRRAIFEHYQSQMGAQPLPEETLPWNKPFPPGVAMQEGFDDMLQERVVDPLAKAGYEQLGAGLAAVPSAAHSMIVPQTEFDVAGTIIPLPGVAKAMKKGKFRKIQNAMKAEDPTDAAEIIAKQARKEVPPSAAIEGPKAEVRAIDEKEMLRKADESNAREKQVDKMLRTTEPASDWTKLKDNADYIFEGRKIKGKDLREELLQMSTGDFHTAEWELYDPKKDMFKFDQKERMKRDTAKIEADDDVQDRMSRIKASMSKIEQLMEELKKQKPSTPLKSVEPPKGPKGDPEASLPGNPDKFAQIRSQLGVAPSRMDERGQSFDKIGQSDFTPNDMSRVIREDVPRRNYVESDMGPPVSELYPPDTGRAFQRIYMDKTPEELENDAVLTQILGGGPASDAWDLQKQMYKGRPSFEVEQEKFGKVKEAMKEAPKAKSGPTYTQGKYHITDWAGNGYPQLGTFDDSDDAFEYLQEFLRKGNKNLSDEELEDLLQDWVITEKTKKGR